MQTRCVGRPDTGRFAEPPFATGRMAMAEYRMSPVFSIVSDGFRWRLVREKDKARPNRLRSRSLVLN
ncbi:hypothetical protein GCM10027299_13970 [Larkinella ripae]